MARTGGGGSSLTPYGNGQVSDLTQYQIGNAPGGVAPTGVVDPTAGMTDDEKAAYLALKAQMDALKRWDAVSATISGLSKNAPMPTVQSYQSSSIQKPIPTPSYSPGPPPPRTTIAPPKGVLPVPVIPKVVTPTVTFRQSTYFGGR